MKKWIVSVILLGFSLGTLAATNAMQLVNDAKKQINVTVGYDPAYRKMAFPMGDVPLQTGVCTDVVIRAYRHQQIDLQKLVNQDMKKAWSSYPKLWGLKSTDTNIDHRRVPNLETFFQRYAKSLSLTDITSFKAGDIVTWRLPRNLPHIGIISDKKTSAGIPLVIHNIGAGTQEEDILFKYKMIGHYRY
ncbi:TPA: DUF1287 domain-containing protein [Pasteurella multocida]|uniref:DUF1287 domain-containing protein n=1 Tax=Pasteurella multocida TaxID=747 RepID=UPI0028DF08F1|nr:DUF1287 domain-containing protein [Pasteurella multocida]MDY0498389.1 DUF1287 domain-containing protein [Pasteurella multocida]MDY0655046.1 DUF1287 domain-containing protein [Pasteurella multocida]WRU41336.1 DUF1287 domain-containing protein [Pasteurella multocida]HDR1919839.1 DUF1287 domain-containing protein [Pasteurella multocida]HEA3244255.1 DUF1287 domain-containing protein [Pasteurella multocida]